MAAVAQQTNNVKSSFYLLERNGQRNDMFESKTNKVVPTPPYRPYHCIPLESTIVWAYDKNGKPLPENKIGTEEWNESVHNTRRIRYYTGCSTLFVDEQPKEEKTIENFLRNRANAMEFVNGNLTVPPYDNMRKKFLTWASLNEISPVKANHIPSIYKMYDSKEVANEKSTIARKRLEAMKKAEEADEKQIMYHAIHLGIDTWDYDLDQTKDMELLKAEYISMANEEPIVFLSSFNSPNLKIEYYIKQGLSNGALTTQILEGKLCWGKSKAVICDVPVTSDRDLLISHILEFAQTNEGTSFQTLLKTMFS